MSAFSAAVKRAFAQRSFVAAAAVLALCALTLNATVKALELKFEKLPVPLRVTSLREGIPQQLGHWVMISTDHSIDPEIEEVLGTAQYAFRDYVDDRKIAREDIEKLRNAAPTERELMLAKLQKVNPLAIMRVSVTYYTGKVDTVAHVPERCYVADGFDVTSHLTKHAVLGRYADGRPRELDYSYLSFEDQVGLGGRVQRVGRNVGYVFHCDGEYISSAYEVRRKLQNLFEPYAYYAKIEMMTVAQDPDLGFDVGPMAGQADSSPAMEDFLTQALPEFEKCLSDWESLPLHKKK